MKGLILSGGKGTRLRPITYTGAKQLIPVANKPILFYVIENIVDAGISDIGIVISPETGPEIESAVGDGARWGAHITYIPQEKPLGLSHAVIVARPFLENDSFVMYLGDNLLGTNIRAFKNNFEETNADASILLKPVDNPSSFGVATVNESGRVIRLEEKPARPESNLALVGVYIFSPKIHKAIDRINPSARGELEITDAIQKLMETGGTVKSHIVSEWWLDTGKKDDMLTANTIVLDEWIKMDIRGTVDESSQVQGRVSIAENAQVINSHIRGPAVIGRGTKISDTFIGPFTSIGDGCIVERSVIEHAVVLKEAVIRDIDRLEDSLVGRRAVVSKNKRFHNAYRLMIGDDSVVEV